jgi:hypothetical protein
MDIKKRATPVNFHALGYTISPCTSRKIAHFRLKGLFNLSMKRVLRQSVSTPLVMCRESMCAVCKFNDRLERERDKNAAIVSVLLFELSFTRLLGTRIDNEFKFN